MCYDEFDPVMIADMKKCSRREEKDAEIKKEKNDVIRSQNNDYTSRNRFVL